MTSDRRRNAFSHLVSLQMADSLGIGSRQRSMLRAAISTPDSKVRPEDRALHRVAETLLPWHHPTANEVNAA
jgi:hypothetical protein